MSPLLKIRSLAPLACFLALLSCEPPKSKNPLSDPSAAKPDPRLHGVWVGNVGDSTASLHVIPKEGPLFDLVLVGDDEKKGAFVLTFDSFVSNIGGKSYLNLRTKSFKGEYAESSEIAPEYIFARYELGKDGTLTFWNMSAKLVEEAVKAGTLAGSIQGQTAHLTGESATIAEYVKSADATKLFEKIASFKRVSTAPKKK